MSKALIKSPLLAAALVAIGQVQAATFDFQSDTVGSAPSNGLLNVNAVGTTPSGSPGVLVVDSSSMPADPFGIPGNQSLQMMKMLGGSPDARVKFGFGNTFPTAITSGKLELDFYFSLDIPNGYTNPSLGIVLGSGGNLNQNYTLAGFGPVIEMRGYARDIRVYENGGFTTRILDQEVFSNQINHLVVDWSAVSKTFTLTLNDVLLTYNGGANSTFQFLSSPASLDSTILYNVVGSDMLTFVDNVVVPDPVEPRWKLDEDGNWSDPGKWDNGVPNAVGAVANFTDAILNSRTVTNDAAHTAGALNFNNLNAYQIVGANTLTLDTGGANAQINVLNGSHSISAPLALNKDLDISVTNGGDTLSILGSVTATGRTINKTGAGVVQFENIRAAALNAAAGTVKIRAKATNNHSDGTSVVGTLTIAGATDAWTSKVDLTNNSAIVDYSGSSPISTIQNQLKQAYNGGSWSGNGLTSSSAASVAADAGNPHKTAIGYAESSALSLGSFGGQTLSDGTNVVLMYTLSGDATLDGKVNTLDFNALAGNFGNGGSNTWTQGDFNYDGQVDSVDFGALTGNYGFTLPASAPALGAAVPEPSALLVLLALPLVGRRNRAKDANTR